MQICFASIKALTSPQKPMSSISLKAIKNFQRLGGWGTTSIGKVLIFHLMKPVEQVPKHNGMLYVLNPLKSCFSASLQGGKIIFLKRSKKEIKMGFLFLRKNITLCVKLGKLEEIRIQKTLYESRTGWNACPVPEFRGPSAQCQQWSLTSV